MTIKRFRFLSIASLAGLSLFVAACSSEITPGDGADDLSAEERAALNPNGDERYLVSFKGDFEKGKSALKAAGGDVLVGLKSVNAVAAHIPSAAISGLSRNPNVEYIEVDDRREMSSQTVPYGIPMVQADDPAFSGATGAGIQVCIIDSGFYTGHEDLQGIPVTGEDGTPWNQDGCGHGTHVAGTIAAQNNSAGVIGVAPGAVNLHIVRVFGDDCSWTYSSNLVAALDECRQAGADVVSMSLGGSVKSRTEERAFTNAWNAGVLSIAAAGNNGNTRMSYPASYSSVVSVGAVDSNKAHASFSQRNSQVDIAAPGVAVLSTVPWNDTNALSAGGSTFNGTYITGAARGATSGALVDGGLCDATSSSFSGKVVLCQRGSISFVDKVNNVKNSGGVAAVIYNNVSGGFAGTLGEGVTSTIPAIGISQEDGQAALALVGQSGTVTSQLVKPSSGYEAWDGTSMATPHVSGVAALIWSLHPTKTNAQVRAALEATTQDLGAAGRDDLFGNGLVQAKAALDYLASH